MEVDEPVKSTVRESPGLAVLKRLIGYCLIAGLHHIGTRGREEVHPA